MKSPVLGSERALSAWLAAQQIIFSAVTPPDKYPCICVSFSLGGFATVQYVYFEDFTFSPWGIMKVEL